MRGFSLSRRKNRSGKYDVYYLWVTEKGKRTKISTGCHLKHDALEFAQRYLRGEERDTLRAHKPKAIAAPPAAPTAYTLKDFEGDFLAYSSQQHKPKTHQAFKSSFRLFLTYAGPLTPISQVDGLFAQKYITHKAEVTSAVSARRELRAMASAFETAMKWSKIGLNPWRGVKHPRVVDRTPNWITPVDFHLLVMSINMDIHECLVKSPTFIRRHEKEGMVNLLMFRDLLKVAYGTGLRSAELQYLRVQDLDFKRRLIHIQNRKDWSTKTGKQRTIPMSKGVYDVLGALEFGDAPETLVFSMLFKGKSKRVSEDWLGRMFKKYIRRAELNDALRFHDVRHSFASNIMSTGVVTLYHVQQLLGHSDPSTTQIYSHLSPTDLSMATNALDDLLTKAQKEVRKTISKN